MKYHKLLPLVSISFCLIIGGWFVTYGDGDFLSDKNLMIGEFFDAQGDSLLHGRLDVPLNSISSEAFIVEGRCYGYFGITPSLFRLPLNAIFPNKRGHWAPLSELAACALFLFASYALVYEIRRVIFPECPLDSIFNILCSFFLIALGIGSTTIFLLSRPEIFHEALIWSVALSLSSMFWALKYWNTGRISFLVIANLFALLAIHTRPVAGCAALIACSAMLLLRYLLNRNKIDPVSGPSTFRWKEIIYGLSLGILTFCSYLAVIYAKFKTFTGMPVQFNIQFTPERLNNLNGSTTHFSNLAWNVENYFGVAGWKLLFVDNVNNYIQQIILESLNNHPEAIIDGIEPFMSIPVALSALAILAIIGIIGCISKGKKGLSVSALSLSALVGPIILLFYVYTSYRYFHEYLLLMSCAGAVGICVLRINLVQHKIFSIVLVILLVTNITYNLLFSLYYQVNDTNLGPKILQVRDIVYQWNNNFISRLGR